VNDQGQALFAGNPGGIDAIDHDEPIYVPAIPKPTPRRKPPDQPPAAPR